MTRDLTGLLVMILTGAGLFLVVAIWALSVGIGRWVKLQQRPGSHRHSRRQRRTALRLAEHDGRSAVGGLPAASSPVQTPWYSPLFLALLAILFAWAIVWLLQISGRLNGLAPEYISGVSFYWQSLILPVAALGGVVIFLVRGKQRNPTQLTISPEVNPPESSHPGNAISRMSSINPLIIGAVCGLGMWLVVMFLQRILAAWIPASSGGVYSVNLSAVVQWDDPFKVGLLRYLPVTGGTAGLWLAVIFMTLVTPAVTELFFRGYVLPLWVKSWGWAGGLLGSAFLSAIFSLNILSLPAMFLAGICLGWLVRYDRGQNHISQALSFASSKGFIPWMPSSLQSAWMAHTVLNLLMVTVWLWH